MEKNASDYEINDRFEVQTTLGKEFDCAYMFA